MMLAQTRQPTPECLSWIAIDDGPTFLDGPPTAWTKCGLRRGDDRQRCRPVGTPDTAVVGPPCPPAKAMDPICRPAGALRAAKNAVCMAQTLPTRSVVGRQTSTRPS